jgi:hypothetical protein
VLILAKITNDTVVHSAFTEVQGQTFEMAVVALQGICKLVWKGRSRWFSQASPTKDFFSPFVPSW